MWTELLNDKKVVDKRVRRKGHFRHHDELGVKTGILVPFRIFFSISEL